MVPLSPPFPPSPLYFFKIRRGKGEPSVPSCYSTYESARDAVTAKYKAEKLTDERNEAEDLDCEMASEVDVDENESGSTYLYIEKGIHITIQRYSVP
jgi:hypothetical protein